MTLGELVDLTREYMGEAAPFYPPALLVRFLQYAQNLLSLTPRSPLYQRVAVTLEANEMLIDVLTHVPRLVTLRRIVLGNAVTQVTTFQDATLPYLRKISLDALAARRAWLTTTAGTPRLYYEHGRTLVGVWPVPSASMTVTLMARVLPTPFVIEPVTQVPDLAQVPDAPLAQHPMLADIATGLLLLREGTLEGDKGLLRLQGVLSAEQLAALTRRLSRGQRGAGRQVAEPVEVA